jgi:hypothetical protein
MLLVQVSEGVAITALGKVDQLLAGRVGRRRRPDLPVGPTPAG